MHHICILQKKLGRGSRDSEAVDEAQLEEAAMAGTKGQVRIRTAN
jgi:hypothetical protein